MNFNWTHAKRFASALLFVVAPCVTQAQTSRPLQPGELDGAPPPVPVDAAKFDPVDSKIHNTLREALNLRAQGSTSPLAHMSSALRRDDGSVLAEVRFVPTESADAALAMFARHGATSQTRMGDTLHEVWLPLDRARELAGEPDVVAIRPARLARPVIGSKTSEGVAAGNANYWQTFVPSYDGTGMKIAMIDTYDKSIIPGLQTSKDWPAAGKVTCYDLKTGAASPPFTASSCTNGTFGNGGTDDEHKHGDATMEIAYDVAPGATYRAYDTLTVGQWYNAILDAAHVNASGSPVGTVNANVISASLAAPLDGIGDGSAQPGSIAEAAGFAKARGVLYVNAAGNEAERHWGGVFTLASSGNGFHTWNGANTTFNPFGDGAGNVDCIPDGTLVDITMYWNNWTSPGSTHDYDLSLYQETTPGTWFLVTSSNNPQNGGTGQTPQEFIFNYAVSGGATSGCPAHTAVYAVAVVRVAGTTANDNLQVFATTNGGSDLYYRVNARSLDFPADSPNVFSIAAIDVANATSTPLEPFSSQGPVLAAGGGLPVGNPATDTNLKPDVASFDHVSTVTYGTSAFRGTSASTPHAAGMAALFMQKFGIQTTSPTLTSAIIAPLRAISSTGSNDLGTVGKDYQYGYGRLRFQKDASLYFLQQPTTTAVNATMIPPVKIGLLDTEGKPDIYTLYTGANLGLGSNPGGGVLSGGGAALFVQGVATYSALKINPGGTGYTLSATSTPAGLTATSNPFNITTGAAAKLAFTVQPSNVIAGHVVTPTVQVSVEDASGNLVTAGSYQVTLKKTACSTTTPIGGGPIATINGVVSFPALTLYTVANGVQLQATANTLSAATSGSFNVTANTDILFANGFETCRP